jgi:hypothetical protein
MHNGWVICRSTLLKKVIISKKVLIHKKSEQDARTTKIKYGCSCQPIIRYIRLLSVANPLLIFCLEQIKVKTSFLSHSIQPLKFQSLNSLSRKLQLHPAITLRPPNTLNLQVNMLQALGTTVRVGNRKTVIGNFAS